MSWRDTTAIGLERIHHLDHHHVREYADRLAIWRHDEARLTWEEVQAVKCQIWGDRLAVEVYPPDSLVVNLRHTRHLWWSPELSAMVIRVCQHPEFDRARSAPWP